MANIKYFAECNGQPVQLDNVYHLGGASTKASEFEGQCSVCGERHRAERKVEYKRFPTKHECDARCMNATGKVMKCECSCGGKNHGRGHRVSQTVLEVATS
ncbi:hypothetical protein HBA54_04300 [Pelagibius litoralis]|uniref:Uncharacterized protein n=1 Tax=Pelagibius litoralis TaxID=374515 RepID=A0A967EVG1_9PROT|nr:hypothetical protein [Pelagibius litoralis]NIA67804.1 hypothetical protein [Pelagibius litoralis]